MARTILVSMKVGLCKVVLVAITALALGSICCTQTASAVSEDYFNSTTTERLDKLPYVCPPEEISVQHTTGGRTYVYQTVTYVCRGNAAAIAFGNQALTYIRMNTDDSPYYVPLYISRGGTLMFQNSPSVFYIKNTISTNGHTEQRIVRDIAALVSPKTYIGFSAPDHYTLDVDKAPVMGEEGIGSYVYALSHNGRYLVMHEAPNERLILYDLELDVHRQIATSNIAFGNTMGYESSGAVTDDAQYIYVPGWNRILDTTQCTTDGQCRTSESLSGVSGNIVNSIFTQDAKTLLLWPVWSQYIFEITPKNIPLKLPTYLALGDSYSSGEGDREKMLDGTSYYTADTREEQGCHLSVRSYPFLLRDIWNIQADTMHSVACSGALVTNDFLTPLENYEGQHMELHDLLGEERQNFINSTLQHYVPGRIPQLEFVDKDQPDIITLTGGGNDVGFANIIKYCAGDIVETFVFGYTCEYVKGKALNQVLNDAIDSQYKASRQLVEKIKEISPQSKIYYVGYPSFVSGGSGGCALNTGALDSEERTMINESVTRLNGVLRQVAADTGIVYIDIEQVLEGGRLCEGSEYVNGVWDVGLVDVAVGKGSEAFHPNAKGHELIAAAIARQVTNPMMNYLPEPPKSRVVQPVTTTRQEKIADDTLLEGDVLRVELKPSTFAGSSDIVSVGYSQPASLGTLKAAADGSVSALIRLPVSMSAGLHVLTLTGTAPDGTPLRLFQYLTIIARGHQSKTDNDTSRENSAPASAGSLQGVQVTPYLFGENTNGVESHDGLWKGVSGNALIPNLKLSEQSVVGSSVPIDTTKNTSTLWWILAILAATVLTAGALYVSFKKNRD